MEREEKIKKAIETLEIVQMELLNTGCSSNEWTGKLLNKVTKTLDDLSTPIDEAEATGFVDFLDSYRKVDSSENKNIGKWYAKNDGIHGRTYYTTTELHSLYLKTKGGKDGK